MNDLLNVIDNMPGPQFLVLYAVVMAATLSALWWWRRYWEPPMDSGLPPIPKDPDPYAMAYLRGQEREVARLAVFRLMQQGYLELTVAESFVRIAKSGDPPGEPPAMAMERRVLQYFSNPREPHAILSALRGDVREQCKEYYRQFEPDDLVTTPAMKAAAMTGSLASGAIILGLGGFKLWDAIDEGRRNVGFLVLMMTVATIVLVCLSWHRGATRLGQRYLDEIQRNFAGLTDFDDRSPEHASQTAAAGFLAMGIFGVGVLFGTQYSYFHRLFAKPARKSSTGTGASGGGGCGGGGGGGGGGCGGG